MASKAPQEKILILFDLDDTLTPKGKLIKPSMVQALQRLKSTDKYLLAVLTTTGEKNMIQQLGYGTDSDVTNLFDYLLAENGLVAYKSTDGGIEKVAEQDINNKISKEQKSALFDFSHKEINGIIFPFIEISTIEIDENIAQKSHETPDLESHCGDDRGASSVPDPPRLCPRPVGSGQGGRIAGTWHTSPPRGPGEESAREGRPADLWTPDPAVRDLQ